MECNTEGCNKKVQAKGLCHAHYMQQYRKARQEGKIEIPIRDKFKPNEFIISDDVCTIRIYNHKGYVIGETIIDAEDYGLAKDKKWHLHNGYAFTCSGMIALSHLVMNHISNRKILVDHISRDKLDNRKSNLRIVTKSQNALNSKLRIDNKSGCRGISWDGQRNRWFVHIGVKGRNIALGRYKTKIDAIKAYNEATKKYHGTFANTTKI